MPGECLSCEKWRRKELRTADAYLRLGRGSGFPPGTVSPQGWLLSLLQPAPVPVRSLITAKSPSKNTRQLPGPCHTPPAGTVSLNTVHCRRSVGHCGSASCPVSSPDVRPCSCARGTVASVLWVPGSRSATLPTQAGRRGGACGVGLAWHAHGIPVHSPAQEWWQLRGTRSVFFEVRYLFHPRRTALIPWSYVGFSSARLHRHLWRFRTWCSSHGVNLLSKGSFVSRLTSFPVTIYPTVSPIYALLTYNYPYNFAGCSGV